MSKVYNHNCSLSEERTKIHGSTIFLLLLRGGVSRLRGPASPGCGRIFLLFYFILVLIVLAFCLKKKTKKRGKRKIA